MPSITHETVVDLFKNRPTLAAEMLEEVFGQRMPGYEEARVESADLTEIVPADRRADLVVVLVDEQKRPATGIVVEVQLGVDPDKPYVWPVYLAQTRAQHRCPSWLLVVTVERSLVRWCSRPIETGHPGWTLTPLVLGPEAVPVVTDVEQAKAAPEVVVLSAMAHGQSEAGEAIGVAFVGAASGLSEERRALYSDVVLISVNEAVRRKLEAMMNGGYEFQSEFARGYVAKGREAGILEGERKAKADAVLAVLEARRLEIPAEVRERVVASTDLAELDRWVRQAAVVSDARELLATTSA